MYIITNVILTDFECPKCQRKGTIQVDKLEIQEAAVSLEIFCPNCKNVSIVDYVIV